MKFIDKTINKEAGDTLVDHFLDNHWDSETNSYCQIRYTDATFRHELKQDLKQQLISEQESLCCYCMREINNNNTTLEHIVPQSTNAQTEFDKYSHISIINENVVLQSVFESTANKQVTPPYPHTIAYENLTASCDGRVIDGIPKDNSAKFCNNKRGNEVIEPLFYTEDIHEKIIYKSGGLLVPTDSSFNGTVTSLNLNFLTLKRIRKVWFYLSSENWNNIEHADTEFKRNAILVSCLIDINSEERISLISDFKKAQFWNILLEYKWFYKYFKN